MRLEADDADAVRRLNFRTTRIPRQRDAIRKGERPSFLYLVVEGWAARYGLRRDGTRRITGFLLPSDFCGIHAVCHAPMDHSIVALTDCVMAKVDLADVEALIDEAPAVGRALWRSKLVDEAMLRTWLLNSSDSYRTLAHLLCEFEARLHIGEGGGSRRFALPITQEHLADALGLTGVHVNRMLRRLREAGLIEIKHGQASIPDVDALRRAAAFDAGYLHRRSADVGMRHDED